MAQRLPRERRTVLAYPLIARGDEFDPCGRYFSGSTVVLEEPSGADLRLLFSLHLWHDGTASAPLGFVRFAGEVPGLVRFITGLRPRKTGGARETNGDK